MTDKRIFALKNALQGPTNAFGFDEFDNDAGFESAYLNKGIGDAIVRGIYTDKVPFDRELFLGYYGMSILKPSHIYPILNNLPPYLQDFEYSVHNTEHKLTNCFKLQYCPELLLESTFQYKTLFCNSVMSFEQNTKELMSVNMEYPYIERFCVNRFYSAGDTKRFSVPFVTRRGVPDYIFVYCERIYKNRGIDTLNNPQVETVNINIPENEGNLQSFEMMNSYDFQNLTRRNSNFRANHVENYETYGGVLLSKRDYSSFAQHRGLPGIDNLTGECFITVKENDPWRLLNYSEYSVRVLFIYKRNYLKGDVFKTEFAFH